MSNNISRKTMATSLLSVLTWTLIFASPGMASHPYHVSLTEIQWNPGTSRFEVSMCVWPADLETALRQMTGESINLDEEAELDRMLKYYVESRFSMTQKISPANSTIDSTAVAAVTNALVPAAVPAITNLSRRGKIEWLGCELNRKEAWLHFEVSGLTGVEQCVVENIAMFELNDDQMNHVRLRGLATGFVCTTRQRRHSLVATTAVAER